MKKVICLLLAFLLTVSLLVPAVCAKEYINFKIKETDVPIVSIYGDGSSKIVDRDGNSLSKLGNFANDQGGSSDALEGDSVKEAILNIIKPFLIQGILTNNWEPYYEVLEKEISEAFGDIILDKNGNPANGTHLADYQQRNVNEAKTQNRRNENGKFPTNNDYWFCYDWRLDPCSVADDFHDFIEGVKQATGSPEVSIVSFCIGTNVVCAYLQKYGAEGIRGIGFGGSTCMGVEPISEAISGKFNVDGYAIERILADGEAYDMISIDSFITDTIDLAVKSGLLDTVTEAVKLTVYRRIIKGVTSALTLASVSYPSYWACVRPEDFDEALVYVFGEEGSKKRQEYAGLIEKITYYNENVKKKIPEMLDGLRDKVNFAVVSKYGAQLLPICESRDMIADSFVSVYSSSFGAKTGTIYEPLSDSYIAGQTKKGLGRYISPDGIVDASTCLFPDNTWFIKGRQHSKWADETKNLMYTVITADRQLTVNDFSLTQFIVPTEKNGTTLTAMTVDNCDIENWDIQQDIQDQKNIFTRLRAFFTSLIKWFRSLFSFLNPDEAAAE